MLAAGVKILEVTCNTAGHNLGLRKLDFTRTIQGEN